MRARSLLLIAALGLLFFAGLICHPDETLYSDTSDLISLHLPSREFLVHSWRQTGELPRWCPYNFAGMPFIHDIQASAFYPLHWALLWLGEGNQGAGMGWLIVLHVVAAGIGMYMYARSQGLADFGALVSAVGYMFAGKWLLHLLAGGHYNMVPLAWLPFVLLFMERSIRRRSFVDATWAGAIFALIALAAYPYITLYAGIFAVVWTWGCTRDHHSSSAPVYPGSARAAWLLFGAWAGLVALALSAVQLLPGLEAAQLASRSAGIGLSGQFVMDGLRSVVGLVGPPLSDEPNAWENRAALGILWLTLAIVAPAIEKERLRYQAGVTIGLIVFALGGAALLQWLPGFRLFRLPSRMFLITALPLALLAGHASELVIRATSARRFCRRLLIKLTVVVVMLAGLFALVLRTQRPDIGLRLHPYWLTLIISVPGMWWLLGSSLQTWKHRAAWLALLLLDFWGLSWPLVRTRLESELYAQSACVRYLAEHADEHGRVLDFNPADASANDTPLWPGLPAVTCIEPVRGFNPIDVRRYKEFLQFITDEDRPLTTIDQMFTGPILGTFPIKNQQLADLLGIRYLLAPANLQLEAAVQTGVAGKSWRLVSEDNRPTAFNFISIAPGGSDAGLHALPPYRIYESSTVLPRAFFVPEAKPLPERAGVLEALKTTDFRRCVLLEDNSRDWARSSGAATAASRGITIREYVPNRVTLEIAPGPAGFLVLSDVWFPGWACTIDGKSQAIHRANYLFRGVELPATARQVVFQFESQSYRWGQRISLAALAALFGISIGGWLARRAAELGSLSEASRWQLAAFGFLVVGSIAVTGLYAVACLPALDLQDFVEYWAAGKLNASGINPYDPALLYKCQRQVSPGLTEAIMMWNPPWTLTLAMPFGLLPATLGHWLWLIVQAAAMLGSTAWIWHRHGGEPGRTWLGLAITSAFAPAWFVLMMGQVSPLILLGVIAFLEFQSRGRDVWAGASLALAALKPHLVVVFGAAVLLWVLWQRRWGVLAGLIAGVGALSALPWLTNPAVFGQYWNALGGRPPQMLSPTIGSLLRVAFGIEHFRLQFVPVVFGLTWLVWRWHSQRSTWDWIAETPLLLLVSFLSASYGGWPFDIIVLLIPVLQAAIWVRGNRSMAAFGLLALIGFDVIAMLMRNVHYTRYYWYAWMTPMILYAYLSLRRQKSESVASAETRVARPAIVSAP
jgi:hypothetical protein